LEGKNTKKKRENSAASNHICSNPACGKTFTKPLKVENLSSGRTVIYEACPYCLTEIVTEETISPSKQKPIIAEEVAKLVPEIKHEEVVSTTQPQPSMKASNCKHYFGYLSERSSRGIPPEECMICPKIVQCMLKGITV